MQQWSSDDKKTDAHMDIDERLSAYYGPTLPEQPLAPSSWSRLSSQLPSRRPGRRWLRLPWRLAQRRANRTLPFSVQEALSRIAFQANMLSAIQRVQCMLRPDILIPSISVSLLGKRTIRLTLPTQVERSPSQAELDILLASGLARYAYIRQPTYAVRQLLLSTLLFLTFLTTVFILVYLRNAFTPVVLLLIVGLCLLLSIAFFRLLNHQARQIARRADILVVQWIGREQTCQGLHALAARSRTPSHRTWGELSLTERINNICHTPVALEEERFTLVR